MNEPRQHHSPVKFSPEQFDAHEGGTDPARVSEAAHLAAHALVSRGREADDPEVHQRLVQLTDEQGLEGIAELWAQAPAVSLPGALWRLYALRAAARTDPHRMGRWFAAGKGTAQVSDVVAGVAGLPGPRKFARSRTPFCPVRSTAISTSLWSGSLPSVASLRWARNAPRTSRALPSDTRTSGFRGCPARPTNWTPPRRPGESGHWISPRAGFSMDDRCRAVAAPGSII